MVVLAAAICTKSGKALISRQFVEMTRIRIEGLLAAFPKLLGSDKQHTFVETEAVRYVYQPLENFYLLAITNRASNIIEDLETLQLLSKVVPDVAGTANNLTEEKIVDKSFDLIFAFDEVITAGGYREPINLQQIKVNMEMESHEETLHNMIKMSKMETAKDKARDAERSIRERRQEAPMGMGAGGRMEGFGSGGRSSTGGMDSLGNGSSAMPAPQAAPQPTYTSKPSRAPVKGMSLFAQGSKNKSLEDAMAKEDKLAPMAAAMPTEVATAAAATPMQIQHPVMLTVVEKVTATLSRDGMIDNFDVKGSLTLTALDEDAAKCAVQLRPLTANNFTFNCNPKVNKSVFDSSHTIQLKDPSKGFPPQRAVGVLKWTYAGDPEAILPIKINCWPEEESRGRMNVNIEYEMNVSVDAMPNLELHDVQITVPLGTSDSPEILVVDGTHRHNSSTGELVWHVPLIDRSNQTGSLEFNISQKSADAFFPIAVSFSSQTLFCDVEVDSIKSTESGLPVMFGSSKVMMADEYTIE